MSTCGRYHREVFRAISSMGSDAGLSILFLYPVLEADSISEKYKTMLERDCEVILGVYVSSIDSAQESGKYYGRYSDSS